MMENNAILSTNRKDLWMNLECVVALGMCCFEMFSFCFLQGNRFSMSRDQQSLSTGHVGFPITATKISEKTHHCTQVHINLTRYVMHMWTGITKQSCTSLQYTTKLPFFTKFFKNNTNCTIKNETTNKNHTQILHLQYTFTKSSKLLFTYSFSFFKNF